ncbi:unnamed protein product [Cylindrotheca closterium]|uniref:Orc1-like AAA ATPase domain-containing protein n=1 Tax=Cylindrotheca closterium TaxID=2856 RepID=A0AAD2FYC5_9STRA|nr:unnamed protein product [Cylindrotheca closterium]
MTSLELFGREKEVSTLKSCFQRLVNTGPEGIVTDGDVTMTECFLKSEIDKELVLLAGQSGSGKSALSRSVIKDVNNLDNALFVEGKFDLITSNEPYSGVARAFSTICRHLLSHSEESITAVGKLLSKELEDEVCNLIPLIPELKTVVGPYVGSKRNTGNGMPQGSLESRQKRWKYAFRLLSRALNSVFSPIVLVLDDLQWADVSSLQVIDYLVSDMQNPNRLMIIGCYRSEEVEDGDILSSNIEILKERQQKYGFNLTEMKINSCQLDDVNKIIMKKLSIEDKNETLQLAQICYKRTLGNAFFVLQFMAMLEKEGLLEFKKSKSKWIWDMDKIKARANYMSDVVDLLQGRMERMSDEMKLLLQYAACLGTSFTVPTIDIVWKQHGTDDSENTSDVVALLREMEDEAFIEKYGDNGYKWVHDKVQEAAISLTDIVNDAFKFKIGKTLVSALNGKQMDRKLFDVVDMINHGCVSARPDLAALNLRAAEKAEGLSAFESAKSYVQCGIALLPRDCWTSHKDLTLALYYLGTKMQLALDNREAATTFSDAVFARENISVMERLPLSMAFIEKLSAGEAGAKKEALDMSLNLLNELNYPLVWSKKTVAIQAIHNLLKTMKATKKWAEKNEKDALMSAMTDPRLLAITRLLAHVGYNSYHLEQIYLSTLGICHQVNMSLKHGKNDLSGIALVNIGFMSWAVLKEDFSVASSTIEKSLLIQDTLDPQYEGQARWIAYVLCLYWNRAFDNHVALECYKSAMRVGDTEYATYSLALAYVWLPYASGKPLATAMNECPKLILHFNELQQAEQTTSVKMYFQMMASLTKNTDVVPELEGSIFSRKRDSVSTAPLQATLHFLEGELLILSNMDLAAQRALRDGDKYQKLGPGVFLGMIEMFHRGIALFAAARRHKKRKYRTNANKIRKTVKQWIKDGNPNVEHYDLLLDAEHAALSSKTYAKAHKLYQASIESAIKIGHLMHSGLCNERYADFLLHTCSDGAVHRMTEAIRFYGEWGAVGKVNQLKHQIRGIDGSKEACKTTTEPGSSGSCHDL